MTCVQISRDHSILHSPVCSVPVQSCRAPHHTFPFIIIQQERHSLHPFTSVHTAHDVHCNCQDWVVLDWLYFVYLSMWSERSITACTGNMVDICTYIFLHNSISADSYLIQRSMQMIRIKVGTIDTIIVTIDTMCHTSSSGLGLARI